MRRLQSLHEDFIGVSMSNLQLAERIWSDPGFQQSVRAITINSAMSEIPSILSPAKHDVTLDWFHLLRCARVMVGETNEKFNDVGIRILHGCLISSNDLNQKAVAAATLAKIASNPSILLAEKRNLIPPDLLKKLPFDLAMDVAAQQISSTININTKHEFVANDFQSVLWRALSENDWISASAPTSAGKSFILEKWIEHVVSTRHQSTTFYIVPTRALISQVETDFRLMLTDANQDINITSLPLSLSKPKAHNIYIYTQERFHLYLLSNKSIQSADYLIIDEAQKIGSDRRGILLQQVLEMASSRYDHAKFLFASPSTDNPEALLEFAPEGKSKKVVHGNKSTVNQNLIWIEQVPFKPKEWNVNLLIDGESNPAGKIELDNRPSVSQKLPFIAQMISKDSPGNVIYVNRASDAEKVAEILCQFFPNESDDPELLALSEFCEKAVHSKFALRRFVRKGVAFHYGNIPQLIRTEVERLFSAGKIRYLVCTSTLVEGVNLSCRNIFLRNPKRGLYDLMSLDDFWNLAGRAGRWGKEFQGNIFCIDPLKALEWHGGSAPRIKKKHKIEIATQRVHSEFRSFFKYLSEDAKNPAITNRFFEYLFSYLLFRKTFFGKLEASLLSRNLTPEQDMQLTEEIDRAIAALKVPVEIIHRNPGINPYGINALFEYFQSKEAGDFASLIPADPLSDAPILPEGDEDSELPKDAAVDSFVAVFSRMSKHLRAPLGEDNKAFGNALLVVHWMRGYPLNRIIGRQIKYWKNKDPSKSDNAIIRETMERVERVARYETPKYLHCYLDVLTYFFRNLGLKDFEANIENFWLYLEFGVSKQTQISLMALGMSRSSVTVISDYIKEDDFNENQCLHWLATNSWREFSLPRLVQLEIENVLNRHLPLTSISRTP